MTRTRSILRSTVQVLVLLVAAATLSCQSGADVDVELHKRLAGELRDNKLYRAAISEYEKVLDASSLDLKTRANLNYLIGKVYFEDLKDYENAAAYYIKAREIDPNAAFAGEISRNLVTALERMGRMIDAKRELGEAVDIDAEPRQPGDVVVARVGDRDIYLSEVDRRLQAAPPEVQKKFMDPASKKEFVRQYVGMELIYDAAVRENYGQDTAIQRQLRQMKRQLLIEKYVVDNVMPGVKIDSLDVRNFYLANKESRYDDAPFDSVKAQVFLDYQSEKTNAAFNDYLSRMASAEKVEIFEENIR